MSNLPKSYDEDISREPRFLPMPDPTPEVTRIMVIRWKLGTATPEEAALVEAYLNEQH